MSDALKSSPHSAATISRAAILSKLALSRDECRRPVPRVANGIPSFVQENDCLGLPLIGGPVSLASVWRAGA